MTTIISIDVGIKNLAYCTLELNESGIHINDWGIINIIEHINPVCTNIIRKKNCTRDAYFMIKTTINSDDKNIIYFCNKKTCCKQKDLLYTKKQIKKVKRKTCKNIKLQELGINLLSKLQDKKEHLLHVDKIIIENQPVLKNPTMKSVQMILYTYFLEHGLMDSESPISDIILFSARNKLKIYTGPPIECKLKNKYSIRKYLSIEYTKYLIKDNTKWYDFFLSHSKKDDLADCYMQGMYYLTHTYKK